MRGRRQPAGGGASFFVQFETGFDARRPMGRAAKDPTSFFSVFLIHHFYVDPVEFTRLREEPASLRNTLEVGFAFGLDPPAKIWGMKIPQLGLSYELGPDFWAFRFNMGFPF